MYPSRSSDSPAAAPNAVQQQVSQAYKTSSYHGISDRETMAEAFRIMITNLYTAKDAFTQRNLEKMCEINVKTLTIVNLLASTLEDSGALKQPESRKTALFMATLYNDFYMRLTNVLQAPSPAAEFDALAELLKPVYRRWLPNEGVENNQNASNLSGGNY